MKSLPADRPSHLQFQQVGDRYAHGLILRDGPLQQPVLVSQEGTAADSWPASPPFQQLHEQQLAAGQVLWGLGAAGTGHWSGSFVYEPGNSEGGHWNVEIALRTPTHPPWAGSTYRLADLGLEVRQVNDYQIFLTTPGFEVRIETTHDSGRLVCPQHQQLLMIEPAQLWAPKHQTLTWNYRIRYCPRRV